MRGRTKATHCFSWIHTPQYPRPAALGGCFWPSFCPFKEIRAQAQRPSDSAPLQPTRPCLGARLTCGAPGVVIASVGSAANKHRFGSALALHPRTASAIMDSVG